MYFSFASALSLLGTDFTIRLLNAARPPADYRLARFLPSMTSTSYDVSRANMIIRTTMAGLVGMDSPYPEGGIASVDSWYEQTAKIAIANDFNEATIRTLQAIAKEFQLGGGNANRAIADNLLNVTDKLITQALLDREEWMRGQVLGTGKLIWTFNRKTINVDYGIPAGNVLATRTGTDAYDSTTSKFWDDWRVAQDILGWTGLSAVAHPTTINAIVNNPANNAVLIAQGVDGSVTIGRYVNIMSNPQRSADVRDVCTLNSIPFEGEIIDLTDATPPMNTSKKVPFFPKGKISVMGSAGSVALIGQGSTQVPREALGYLHIGPTVEGNGTAGRWGRVFVPENRPFALRYEGAENVLPVITDPTQLVILSTNIGGVQPFVLDNRSGDTPPTDEEVVAASVKQAEQLSTPSKEDAAAAAKEADTAAPATTTRTTTSRTATG